jgi:hypothetical protein
LGKPEDHLFDQPALPDGPRHGTIWVPGGSEARNIAPHKRSVSAELGDDTLGPNEGEFDARLKALGGGDVEGRSVSWATNSTCSIAKHTEIAEVLSRVRESSVAERDGDSPGKPTFPRLVQPGYDAYIAGKRSRAS